VDDWKNILGQLNETLILEKELGRLSVELSQDVVEFVRSKSAVPPPSTLPVPAAPVESEPPPGESIEIAFASMKPMVESGEEYSMFLKMIQSMGLASQEWKLFSLLELGETVAADKSVERLLDRITAHRPKVVVFFGGEIARAVLGKNTAVLSPGQWISVRGVPAVLSRDLGLVVKLQCADDKINLKTIKLEIWNKAMLPALAKIGRSPNFKKK
jgi:hypothetical protein